MLNSLREPATKRGTGWTTVTWLRLLRVGHRARHDGDADLRRHGLSGPQFHLLKRISREGGCTQQQLADELGLTKGNISQMVAKLEAAGLVRRGSDGGGNRLSLSEAGVAKLHALVPVQERFVTEWLSVLTPAELRQLHRLLAKLDRRPVDSAGDHGNAPV